MHTKCTQKVHKMPTQLSASTTQKFENYETEFLDIVITNDPKSIVKYCVHSFHAFFRALTWEQGPRQGQAHFTIVKFRKTP